LKAFKKIIIIIAVMALCGGAFFVYRGCDGDIAGFIDDLRSKMKDGAESLTESVSDTMDDTLSGRTDEDAGSGEVISLDGLHQEGSAGASPDENGSSGGGVPDGVGASGKDGSGSGTSDGNGATGMSGADDGTQDDGEEVFIDDTETLYLYSQLDEFGKKLYRFYYDLVINKDVEGYSRSLTLSEEDYYARMDDFSYVYYAMLREHPEFFYMEMSGMDRVHVEGYAKGDMAYLDMYLDPGPSDENEMIAAFEKAADEFTNIRKSISKHDYTGEERKRIGELEGQCAGYVYKGVKGKITNVGSELNGILQGIFDIINE